MFDDPSSAIEESIEQELLHRAKDWCRENELPKVRLGQYSGWWVADIHMITCTNPKQTLMCSEPNASRVGALMDLQERVKLVRERA